MPVGFAAHHHGPDDAGHPRPAPGQALLANATAASFFGLRASNSNSHGEARPLLACWMTAVAPSTSSRRRLSSPLAADLAGPVLACRGVLARRDADPGRKVPARAKALRIRHPRLRGGRLLSAKLTPPIGPMPGIVAKHWLVWSCLCHAISRASIVFNLAFSTSSWPASRPSISRASAGTPSPVAKRCSSSTT